MPRRVPGQPKVLLATISAVLTTASLIYGTMLGFLSSMMIYLYLLLSIYLICACTDFVSTAYTIAGAVAALVFLFFAKFVDSESSMLGSVICIIVIITVFYATEMIVKCDWRYYSFSVFDFDFSALPLESSLLRRYDQHVPVAVTTPTPIQETEPSEDLESDQRRQLKKNVKSPPSRKERKAEAKKQRRDGKKS